MQSSVLDVSVVLSFTDDEDIIGTAVQRIAHHLNELDLSFEILAVDEDSGDNCHAVLALLRGVVPELKVLCASQPGRGFAAGAASARGRVVCLVDPRSATRSLAALGRAQRRVSRGELDVAVVRGCFSVYKRARAIGLTDGLVGRGQRFERRLIRRASHRGLTCEAYDVGGVPSEKSLGRRLRGRLAMALAFSTQRF